MDYRDKYDLYDIRIRNCKIIYPTYDFAEWYEDDNVLVPIVIRNVSDYIKIILNDLCDKHEFKELISFKKVIEWIEVLVVCENKLIYSVGDVVCDYGVFQNDELILILDSYSRALKIVEILNQENRLCSIKFWVKTSRLS